MTDPPGFLRWWAEYPGYGTRKKGRAKCARIWHRKGLEPIAEQVIACLRRCKASHDWTKEGGKYTPGPQPWLNATPWETDPAEQAAGTSPEGDGGFVHCDFTPEQIRAMAEADA